MVNDLEQDAPEGEDTNEDGCWTEEDDETLQLGYLGSEPCWISSPPGLSDASSEAGWIVVTGNCEIASNAPSDMDAVTSVARFSDHCGTMTTT